MAGDVRPTIARSEMVKAVWPEVKALEDWCGEYKPQPKSTTTD